MTGPLWCVMHPLGWSCIQINDQPGNPPAPGCCGFLPVFSSEQEARDWAGPDLVVAELIHLPISPPDPHP